MNGLQEETKKTLSSIIDKMLLETSSKAAEISLFKLLNYNRSITSELFSQNIEEYLYFMVTQRVTTYFTTGLKNAIGQFSETLIKAQDGQILKNPEPYDLKFKLKNGEEYWLDIKSINDPYFSNGQYIKERQEKSDKKGAKYRLFIYDDENQYDGDYYLNGNDFWELMAGFEHARPEIFKLVNGSANKFSTSSIIKDTHNRLLREWRMQE